MIDMAEFVVRFFIVNIYISGIIVMLVIFKRILRNNLTSRVQYHLWFLLLGLLAVPFIPLQPAGFLLIYLRFKNIQGENESGHRQV